MHTIWEDVAIEKRDCLTQDLKIKVAVIGAGMAGILTAHRLTEAGISCVVLEANTIASGQTKGTTAKITAQHGLIYTTLLKDFKEELARQYAKSNEQAVADYKELIQRYQISCNYEEKDAVLYSTCNKESMRLEAESARILGIDAEYCEDFKLPFPVAAGVIFHHQAQFHPLKFMKKIAEQVTVYEHSKVLKVEGQTLFLENAKVEAEHIVFACHYPFVNIPGYYFMRMHQSRSYLLALKDAPQFPAMYIQAEDGGYTLRNHGAYLLFGGGDHRTGENPDKEQFKELEKVAYKYFPGCSIVTEWSIQDCIPLDHVPYIGRFSNLKPNWYVATGFQKWGMTSSMVASRVITDLILDREVPYAKIFCPQRMDLKNMTKNLVDEGKHAISGLTKCTFQFPKEKVQELAPGHGGIVLLDGEKVGVYKEEDGTIHAVSIKCPHLGCQLEWNPEEKSWDCPCHGSRFDYTGALIDNPAQTDLEKFSNEDNLSLS